MLDDVRHVMNQDEKALHRAIRLIGQKMHEGVAHPGTVWFGNSPLERLRFAAQSRFRMGTIALEQRVAQKLSHRSSRQGRRLDPEPTGIGPVGEAAGQIPVPIADHRWNRVQNGTEGMTRRIQFSRPFHHLPFQIDVELRKAALCRLALSDVAHQLRHADDAPTLVLNDADRD